MDPRRCPECDRPMCKVCPLGRDVGGFIWQCPSCKKVVADWTPVEPPHGPVMHRTVFAPIDAADRDPAGGGTD